MDALCGAPHAGMVVCGGGQLLKTIYTSPLTGFKPILLSREASQDPEPLGGTSSLMEKVQELLGCSVSNWVKLCGCWLQIWVLGTHWVFRVEVFSLPHVPP